MNSDTGRGSGISCTTTSAGALVTVWGDVDSAFDRDAQRAVSDLGRQSGPITIDMSRVRFIDSAGLALILQLYRFSTVRQRQLFLYDPAPVVEDLLAMVGMSGRIPTIRAASRDRLIA